MLNENLDSSCGTPDMTGPYVCNATIETNQTWLSPLSKSEVGCLRRSYQSWDFRWHLSTQKLVNCWNLKMFLSQRSDKKYKRSWKQSITSLKSKWITMDWFNLHRTSSMSSKNMKFITLWFSCIWHNGTASNFRFLGTMNLRLSGNLTRKSFVHSYRQEKH